MKWPWEQKRPIIAAVLPEELINRKPQKVKDLGVDDGIYAVHHENVRVDEETGEAMVWEDANLFKNESYSRVTFPITRDDSGGLVIEIHAGMKILPVDNIKLTHDNRMFRRDWQYFEPIFRVFYQGKEYSRAR